MENTTLIFDKEAREKLAKGADILARAVTSTLGPMSRNVAINSVPPVVLHDGVSIARQIKLKDPFEDMGASLLREAASKTNDLAGDGTTTATLLANTLLQGGLKLIEKGIKDGQIMTGYNPMQLKDKLDDIASQIVNKLDKKSIEVTDEMLDSIATISSASPQLGKLVADAIREVGTEGLVMVETSDDWETKIEYKKGMEFDNGFLHRGFVTDPHRMVTDYEDAYVLLTDMTISSHEPITGILEEVIKSGKPLIIIANDVVGVAIHTLLALKFNDKTNAQVVAVMAPEFADRRQEALEDIAILTGGTVISIEKGMKLEDVKISDLGRASSVFVTQTHTKIVPLNPDDEEISERCNSIKKQITEEENPMRRASMESRLARLSQGTAIIKVGGASKTEIGDRRERVIDAVHAVKSALDEGIVAGGGVVLAQISKEIKVDDDLKNLINETLTKPYRVLLENSGIEYVEPKGNTGIDVKTGKKVDMVKAGIIDPVKVTKMGVIHAFSVTGMILTTNCLITEDKDTTVQKMKLVQ